MIPVRNGKVKGKQLDIPTPVPVSAFLASRGFEVSSESSTTQTILPKTPDYWEPTELNSIYDLFHTPSCRNELRNHILHDAKLQSEKVTKVTNLPECDLEENRFTATFEWYLGELLVREFGAFSSSFGVKLNDIKRNLDNGDAGDFDVLAVLRNMNLLYIEAKTGTYNQNDVVKAVQRGLSIHSLATVMLVGRNTEEEQITSILQGYTHPNLSPFRRLATIEIKDVPESKVFRCWVCLFRLTAPLTTWFLNCEPY